MKVEIAGSGCPRCRAAERNVKEALGQLGRDVQVEHIFNAREFVKRGVVLTPAVLVDGKIVSSGRVPSVDELQELFMKM